MCFHCNQVDHKKADHPRLRGGAVSVPAPVTLRNTDGREGRDGALTARRRAEHIQFGGGHSFMRCYHGYITFVSSMYHCPCKCATESCVCMCKQYVGFSSLLLSNLYYQGLAYAILHTEIHEQDTSC